MIILSVQNVAKSFGVNAVLRDVSLTVQQGERIGLVGVNGCGKSTLMRIIAGLDSQDSGEIALVRGTRVGYLAQGIGMTRAAGHAVHLLHRHHVGIDFLEHPGCAQIVQAPVHTHTVLYVVRRHPQPAFPSRGLCFGGYGCRQNGSDQHQHGASHQGEGSGLHLFCCLCSKLFVGCKVRNKSQNEQEYVHKSFVFHDKSWFRLRLCRLVVRPSGGCLRARCQ